MEFFKRQGVIFAMILSVIFNRSAYEFEIIQAHRLPDPGFILAHWEEQGTGNLMQRRSNQYLLTLLVIRTIRNALSHSRWIHPQELTR